MLGIGFNFFIAVKISSLKWREGPTQAKLRHSGKEA